MAIRRSFRRTNTRMRGTGRGRFGSNVIPPSPATTPPGEAPKFTLPWKRAAIPDERAEAIATVKATPTYKQNWAKYLPSYEQQQSESRYVGRFQPMGSAKFKNNTPYPSPGELWTDPNLTGFQALGGTFDYYFGNQRPGWFDIASGDINRPYFNSVGVYSPYNPGWNAHSAYQQQLAREKAAKEKARLMEIANARYQQGYNKQEAMERPFKKRGGYHPRVEKPRFSNMPLVEKNKGNQGVLPPLDTGGGGGYYPEPWYPPIGGGSGTYSSLSPYAQYQRGGAAQGAQAPGTPQVATAGFQQRAGANPTLYPARWMQLLTNWRI